MRDTTRTQHHGRVRPTAIITSAERCSLRASPARIGICCPVFDHYAGGDGGAHTQCGVGTYTSCPVRFCRGAGRWPQVQAGEKLNRRHGSSIRHALFALPTEIVRVDEDLLCGRSGTTGSESQDSRTSDSYAEGNLVGRLDPIFRGSPPTGTLIAMRRGSLSVTRSLRRIYTHDGRWHVRHSCAPGWVAKCARHRPG